jgi:hypothetical protein
MRTTAGRLALALTATLLFSPFGTSNAGEPLRPPWKREVWSHNEQFVAVMDPRSWTTTVYRIGEEGRRKKRWAMYGWFRVASLTDDGERLVAGYDGMNLLRPDFEMDQVMLYFFHRGALKSHVTLGELVKEKASIERRESGEYHWGDYRGLDAHDRYVVETVEKRKILFNVSLGRAVDPIWGRPTELPGAMPEREASEKPASDGGEKAAHTPRCPDGCARCTEAIRKALDHIVSRQHPAGHWVHGGQTWGGRGYVETALCGLALLAEGSTSRRGPHEERIEKAVAFLVKKIRDDGRMSTDDTYASFDTWCVAFTALFLSEVALRDGREDLEEKLTALGRRLENLQRETGGYSHGLRPRALVGPGGSLYYSEDLVAATNVVVLAIHALAKAGVEVSADTRRRIRDYYAKVRNPDGGFRYGLLHIYEPSEKSERTRTLGGVLALLLLGTPAEDRIIRDARAYVRQEFKEIPFSPIHKYKAYTVGALTGALACRWLGEREWERFVAEILPWMLDRQDEKGVFRIAIAHTPGLLDTAFLAIVLQIPKGHIRIFEP